MHATPMLLGPWTFSFSSFSYASDEPSQSPLLSSFHNHMEATASDYLHLPPEAKPVQESDKLLSQICFNGNEVVELTFAYQRISIQLNIVLGQMMRESFTSRTIYRPEAITDWLSLATYHAECLLIGIRHF